MATYQNIQFRLEDRVGRITFARPPLNVFNIEMMREIARALGECVRRDLVAIDNLRVTRDFFNARLAEKKPGDLINLTIFRFDDLSTLLIKLGPGREGMYRIVPLTSQTDAQKKIYRDWLRTA